MECYDRKNNNIRLPHKVDNENPHPLSLEVGGNLLFYKLMLLGYQSFLKVNFIYFYFEIYLLQTFISL